MPTKTITIVEKNIFFKKLYTYLIELINKDRSLLDHITEKQREYSDKSVYENIDQEINKIINEKN